MLTFGALTLRRSELVSEQKRHLQFIQGSELTIQAPIEPEMSPCFDITPNWSRITPFKCVPRKKKGPASRLTAILILMYFFLSFS